MLTAVLVKAADRPAQRRLGVCGLEPRFLRERLLDADEVGWRGIGGRKQVVDRERGIADEEVAQNIAGAVDRVIAVVGNQRIIAVETTRVGDLCRRSWWERVM